MSGNVKTDLVTHNDYNRTHAPWSGVEWAQVISRGKQSGFLQLGQCYKGHGYCDVN